mmetsp:Transcript_2419/g.4678  ORF Transcript_2419/g.4678 Transcript_2419/m.4678 type:complete len:432 (-) Transcript_2419:162-1457(-)|eukprot:CAMPEP_0119061112 /NCGR_PEP_ID=MMETSP1178-20130426/4958_1 /TAXON_ID=33656 /ORGANISM="unid sp, Strain CCMP2000" /LENGTH=431 /DNA_ID=CAMNT_0007042287 /DNA_START=62 /DNA_END=1357 /DNA_ORIENTATION=-
MLAELQPMLAQLPSDAERVSMLTALPAPPEIKVTIGMMALSPEADAFKLLKPLSKDMDGLSRNLFKSFAKMSDAEIEAGIKEDQANLRADGVTITPEKDLLRKGPNERRRGFFAGILTGSKLLKQEEGDESDSDEFGYDPWGGGVSSDSSDDSDDDEEEDLAKLPPTVRKYKEVLASLEKDDARIIWLAEPFDQDTDKPKDVTAKKLLSADHLMLPRDAADAARSYSKKARKLVCNWMGGGTSCGNAVWSRYLHPALEEAEEAIAAGDHAAALGPLIGVLLIGQFDDGWLRDQEEYCEWDAFEGWFAGLSLAWQAVLAQSDEAIGLAWPRGRQEAGHYRKELLKMLTSWEKEVNDALDDLNDCAEPGGKKAKLTATKKGPAPRGKAKAKAAPKAAVAPRAVPKSKTAAAGAGVASSSQPNPRSGGKRRRGQ